jgi:cytochrome bd-type quinol oxidase subunit 2
MPTLTLIITALGYTALDPSRSKTVVRKDFVRLAQWLSIVYLVLVAMTILIGPVAAKDGPGMVKLMHMSNLWLGPFQGLVASAIGVLFVTKQKQGAERS